MMIVRVAMIASTVAMLGGCASFMSGIGNSTDKFACGAPDGVTCASVSGVYANSVQNNLPAQRGRNGFVVTPESAGAAVAEQKSVPAVAVARGMMLSSGEPVWSNPRRLRIWFSPYRDTDGDGHDQKFVYVQVDNGKLMIEHNQSRIREIYRPSKKTAAPAPVQHDGAVTPTLDAAPLPQQHNNNADAKFSWFE